jgi:hypothetical protein
MEQINELSERVAWLERKMVRVLWALISSASALLGWIVANALAGEQRGWAWGTLFLGIWLTAGFILQRIEFKGAPSHIEFIDP